MKTNYHQHTVAGRRQRSLKGFTLIEITLVISLILSLIAILFIGITAYKAGADKAKCLLIQVTCQKAVRAYQNLNNLTPNVDGAVESTVVGPGLYAADPGVVCPNGSNTLTYAALIPLEGSEWVTCDFATHVPVNTNGW